MKWYERHGLRKAAVLMTATILVFCASAAGQEKPVPKKDRKAVPKAKADKDTAVRQTRPGSLELHAQDLELTKVLKLLSTQGKKNIIASKEVSGKVTADLYGVTFEEALDAVLSATGFTYVKKDGFIYVMTMQQKEALIKASRKTEQATFYLSYVTAKDAKALIEPVLSTDGKMTITPDAEVGIATSDSDAGGNALATRDVLIVYDYKENIAAARKLIEELDRKPDQVMVEATILTASLTEDSDLGINFNVLAGIDFDDVAAVTTGLTGMAAPNLTAGQAPVIGAQTSFPQVQNGLNIGFLGNNVAVFLSALEKVTDLTILANPKLLVLNKQRGEVLIGERQGYKTTTTTETAATESIEFLETGTRLVVRPYICRDGLIRMEIHPEESSGSVSSDGLPSEETTEVTSNVMIKDGHTFVIGGLFREQTQSGRSQIPLLGDIPYAGVLFRQTADDTRRKEIIILVTPHIIQQEVDEAVSEQLKDEVERFRIGARKGLRWWGRSRMSQTHMRCAKQALREGDRDKAEWQVDMALSIHPRMEEAIRLKERLTQKAYWADQSQTSSIKYVIERMVSEELGKPVERVIPPRKPRDGDKVEEPVRSGLGIRKRTEDPLIGEPGGE
jgi:type IV pilus assembly protein PilQ